MDPTRASRVASRSARFFPFPRARTIQRARFHDPDFGGRPSPPSPPTSKKSPAVSGGALAPRRCPAEQPGRRGRPEAWEPRSGPQVLLARSPWPRDARRLALRCWCRRRCPQVTGQASLPPWGPPVRPSPPGRCAERPGTPPLLPVPPRPGGWSARRPPGKTHGSQRAGPRPRRAEAGQASPPLSPRQGPASVTAVRRPPQFVPRCARRPDSPSPRGRRRAGRQRPR